MNDSAEDKQYVVCPDKECKGFWSEDNEGFLCDGKCPKDCQFYIICPNCKHKIYFDPKYISKLQRIECNNQIPHPTLDEKYRCGCCIFTRISSSTYNLTYHED